MPRAMRRTTSALRPRRIRDLHDAGGALKSSTEPVSVSLDSRERVFPRQLGCLLHFSRTPLFVHFALCVLCVYFSGCASRKPIADRRQPPPAQPSETPAETAEAAKRSTDVDAPTVPSAPAPSAKRNKSVSVPAPSGYTEEGNASWYGVPFHGRHASNGEIYDMYKLTAAHRTLPFETMVLVTNLNNGKSTVVRITDRGPFVDNRIIDLSLAAAREIESIGPGIVPVRIEVLGNVDVTAGFFTVQVGAFHDRGNAERLRDRLGISYSPIFIQQYDSSDGPFYRVRVGRISGQQAAQDFGERLHNAEGFSPMVIRLDEKVPSGVK